MTSFFRSRRTFLIALISVMTSLAACRTLSPKSDGNASSIKSVWIPQGGLIVKQGFLIYGSAAGDAVCYASVRGNQGQVLGQAEPTSFKSVLTQLYYQSTQDPQSAQRVEGYYQSYIMSPTQIDATRFTDPSAQILTNLAYQAVMQGQSASNPAACNSAGGGGQTGQSPSHLFVLLSYGRSITPGRTHTFGFFAKMDPQSPGRIVEHVPFSWLPVVTEPSDDVNGRPVKDSSGRIDIADVMSAFSRPRLGWNFSISKTAEFRRVRLGANDITANGAFIVNPDQYERAKAFRSEMNRNTTLAMNGAQISAAGYFYQAANDNLFSCPNGRIPNSINCFQSILAAFGTCETSGPLSGVGVTEFLRGKLQGRGLLGDFYYRDPSQISQLISQIEPLEAGGVFDRPGNH